MKILIPMAGRGTRLRPHTLVTPKPLFKIAGKTLVEHLLSNLQTMFAEEKITHIGFIIGDFGKPVETQLLALAHHLDAKGEIFHQHEALGTAHALHVAASFLEGKVIVAYADTLFATNQTLPADAEVSLFVKSIENPSAFGVVQLNDQQQIIDFIEKPQTPVSNLAMIGIYYFKAAEKLKSAVQHLIDTQKTNAGEYQLPDALRLLLQRGLRFRPTIVDNWLDCGNAKAVLEAQHFVLDNLPRQEKKNQTIINSVVIAPVYLAQNIHLENAIVGPYVSLEEGVVVKNAQIAEAIIGVHTQIDNAVIRHTITGKNCVLKANSHSLSLADYSHVEL